MNGLTSQDLTVFLTAIGLMLILARILSRIGARINVPTLVAELLAGILIGPTILGNFFPSIYQFFFPETGNLPDAYDTIFNLSVIMLLFLAGMELDFSLISKERRAIIATSIFAIFLPFGIGLLFSWYFFYFFHGTELSAAPFVFPLIFGTLLTVSSLAAVIRVLMSLDILNTTIGVTIIGTAVLTDLFGWFGFSSIITYANPTLENIHIFYTAIYIVIFFALTFIVSSSGKFMGKIFSQREPGKQEVSYDLAMLFGICLLSGAFTNAIHIHPSLGAFIAGILCKRVVGENSAILQQLKLFIMNFFAPIFFISIGLKLNFALNFNLSMILAVFFLAIVSKVTGGLIGAYIGGFEFKKALFISCCLNTRGSLEIIMAVLAMKIGLIMPQLCVAFILMSIIVICVTLFLLPLLSRLIETNKSPNLS